MLQIMFMKCEIMEVTLKESENGQDHVVSYWKGKHLLMFLDNFSLSLKASEAKSLACKLHFQFSNVEGQCEAMLGVTKKIFY